MNTSRLFYLQLFYNDFIFFYKMNELLLGVQSTGERSDGQKG